MVYIATGKPDLSAFPCEEVDQHNGLFAYRLVTTGKFLSLNIFDGTWKQEDTPGPWELFKKGPKALILDLTWDGVRYTFLRLYDEA